MGVGGGLNADRLLSAAPDYRIVQRQSETNRWVEIIGLAGGAEGALQAYRRQGPGVTPDGELAVFGVAGFCGWVVSGRCPLGCAAGKIMDAPGRFVLEVFPL